MWNTATQIPEHEYDYLLKIIVVGDSSVGKSCLLLRYTDKRFRFDHEVTVGVDFGSRIVEAQGLRFKTHVWDTAGQESFRSITRAYYRTAAVALLVFDLTKRSTFEHLREWSEDVLCHAAPGVVLVVVANKVDLRDKREVSTEEAEAYSSQIGATYFETSAKEATQVDDVFVSPCLEAIRRDSIEPNSNVYKSRPGRVKESQACCYR